MWPLVLIALAGLMAILVAILASPAIRDVLDLVGTRLRDALGIG